MKEIWKDIVWPKNYKGLYQISNLGNIRSLTRFKKSSYGSMSKLIGIIRKPILYKKTGYLSIILSDGISRKQILIHRLVAFHFIDNPENKPCVNHINSIRNDNRYNNLEWCTYQQNYIHSVSLNRSTKGIFKIDQFDLNGNYITSFKSISEIEKLLCFSKSNIQKHLNKHSRYKTCYGFIWEYASI